MRSASTARTATRAARGRVLCATLVLALLLSTSPALAQGPGAAARSTPADLPSEQMHNVYAGAEPSRDRGTHTHTHTHSSRLVCLVCRVRAWARVLGDRLQHAVRTITAYETIRKVRPPRVQLDTEPVHCAQCSCGRGAQNQSTGVCYARRR